jgi:hypothetical protein
VHDGEWRWRFPVQSAVAAAEQTSVDGGGGDCVESGGKEIAQRGI